ncbi:glycosyltransferase [Sinomonas atrocyanea]|uniref:glycosyltransferase n=1 Tax=Sinomonas atrocyanea TaxID=37927 RepID=UPI003D97D665
MKILFASLTQDGHFNPLTGIAVAAQNAGHDVAFYTGSLYAGKLGRMGVRHEPYRRAVEITAENINEVFPERVRLSGPRQIAFDGRAIFADNVGRFFEDLREIHREFPFTVLVHDTGFFAAELAVRLLGVHSVPVNVIGDIESDPDVPPMFFGFGQARNRLDRAKHAAARYLSNQVVFRPAKVRYREILAEHGVPFSLRTVMTDLPYRYATAVIQTGTQSLDFPRSRVNPKVRHVGALLPWRDPGGHRGADVPLGGYRRRALISQGTIDTADFAKLVYPAVEALRGSGMQLVVSTGRQPAAPVRERIGGPDVVVEEFVDFDAVLPASDVYITNGGQGGVLMAIANGVPMVVAGLNEGKGDVNARLAFRGLAEDLRTERPRAEAIRAAVDRVLADDAMRARVAAVRAELAAHDPLAESIEVIESAGARLQHRP